MNKITKALHEAEVAVSAKSKDSKVFVRNLAAYNKGSSAGVWITPVGDPDELEAAIRKGLRVPDEVDLEWAIHDYENFPNLGEHASAEEVAEVVQLVEEHGQGPVIAAMSYQGNNVKFARKMLSNGFREFDEPDSEKALEQYAEENAEEGLYSEKMLLQYVDYSRLGLDLDINGDVTALEQGGKTYIFNR